MPRPRAPIAAALLAAALVGALALPRLGSPPADVHSWRQALGLSVARAWSCGQPAAFPRLDACGDAPDEGVVAMELPLYAYAGALAGRAADPWFGARLVALLSAAAAAAGLALVIAFVLAPLLPPAIAAAAAFAGGAVYAWSPVARHWMLSILPDGVAWGVVLLATGALLHLRPGAWGRLAAGALLCGLGVATKLITAPFLLAGALLLVAHWWKQGRLRALGAAAAYGALALLPSLLWYGLWTRRLDELGSCDLFYLRTASDPLAQIISEEARRIAAGHLRSSAGAAWPLVLLGAPIALWFARSRLLAVVGATAVGFALVASLGWHARVHEYDALVYQPLLGLCLAGAVAGLARAFAARSARWQRAFAWGAATLLVLVLAGLATRPAEGRATTEAQAFARLAVDLDRALPAAEVLSLGREPWDPRVSYFAGRRTRRLSDDGPLCAAESPALHDCIAYPRDPSPGPPCRPLRSTATLLTPRLELYCGLVDPESAPARLRRHLEEQLAQPPREQAHWPGLGRVVGAELVETWAGTQLDLVLEVSVPRRLPHSIRAELNGEPVELSLPGGARSRAGPLFVTASAVLEGPGAAEALLRVHHPTAPTESTPAWEVRLDRKQAATAAWRCPPER